MRNFNQLPEVQQEDINSRYILPSDTSNIRVNNHGQPMVDSVVCTVKMSATIDGGFHNHYSQK